jgi:hypothetical protein
MTIRGVVTATNAAGSASATSAQTPVVGSAGPANTALPTISGTATDGQSSATSAATDVVSGGDAPVVKTKPSVSGIATVGEELTADAGTWTGGATTFTFQWQRCDSAGAGCVDVTNATARSYGVRSADAGHKLRVEVTAKNASSTATATSDPTAVVRSASTPTPTPTPAANKAPSIAFLSLRHVGVRVIARFRICDDGLKPVAVVQRDLKVGVLAYTRHFASGAKPCTVAQRTWKPAPRFHNGRYTATLRAVDKSGRSSRTVSRSLSL